MVEKKINNLYNIIDVFIETTKKHNEILERQTESLINNTINKDCKSKIYERIADIEEKLTKQSIRLDTNKKTIEEIDNFIKGDGYYAKGLLTEINELKDNIRELRDFFKEQSTTKKNMISLYNFLSGVGGAGLIFIIQHFFK